MDWMMTDENKRALMSELWTPVSERLPESQGEYMVTVEYTGRGYKRTRVVLSSRYTKTKGWHLSIGRVVAWMPMIDPWGD